MKRREYPEFLDRDDLVAALRAIGLPTSASSLAMHATRNTGPPFKKNGKRVVYPWADALAWAKARLKPPIRQIRDAARKAAEAEAVSP